MFGMLNAQWTARRGEGTIAFMDNALTPRRAAGNSVPANDRRLESPKSAVPAVARAARLLDTVAESPEPVSLGTLTRQLDLPKSTVHGLCATLVHAGLLTRFENGTYHLGLHVMDLAHSFLARTDLTVEFVKLWESLALLPEETIILSVLDGADVVYVACRNGSRPLGLNFRIGMRQPANCTASGKAMLSSLPPDRVKALLTAAGLRTLTKKKTGGMQGLLRQLAQARKSRLLGRRRGNPRRHDLLRRTGVRFQERRSRRRGGGQYAQGSGYSTPPRTCRASGQANGSGIVETPWRARSLVGVGSHPWQVRQSFARIGDPSNDRAATMLWASQVECLDSQRLRFVSARIRRHVRRAPATTSGERRHAKIPS